MGYNSWLLLLKTVGGGNLAMKFNNTWLPTMLSEFTRAKGYLEEAGEACGPVHLLPDIGTHLNAAVSTVGLDTGKQMISFGNTHWQIEFR